MKCDFIVARGFIIAKSQGNIIAVDAISLRNIRALAAGIDAHFPLWKLVMSLAADRYLASRLSTQLLQGKM